MTQDLTRLERGWGLIAEGAMEISLGYAAMTQPARAGSPLPSEPADPDVLPFDPVEEEAFLQHVEKVSGGERVDEIRPDTALGRCPVHDKPWTVKAAGTSKAGIPFEAFWKCAERDASGFCKEKPLRAWRDSHPIREGAAA